MAESVVVTVRIAPREEGYLVTIDRENSDPQVGQLDFSVADDGTMGSSIQLLQNAMRESGVLVVHPEPYDTKKLVRDGGGTITFTIP